MSKVLTWTRGLGSAYIGPGLSPILVGFTGPSSFTVPAVYMVGDEGSLVVDTVNIVTQMSGTYDDPIVLPQRYHLMPLSITSPLVGTPSNTPTAFTMPTAIRSRLGTNVRFFFAWDSTPASGALAARWRLYDVTHSLTILSGAASAGTFTRTIVQETGAASNLPLTAAEVELQFYFSGADLGTIKLYGMPTWDVY